MKLSAMQKFTSGEVWIFIDIDQFLPFGKAV
jgi:hypothetical protein